MTIFYRPGQGEWVPKEAEDAVVVHIDNGE